MVDSCIPALRRLRQDDHIFEANLSYIMMPQLKNSTNSAILAPVEACWERQVCLESLVQGHICWLQAGTKESTRLFLKLKVFMLRWNQVLLGKRCVYVYKAKNNNDSWRQSKNKTKQKPEWSGEKKLRPEETEAWITLHFKATFLQRPLDTESVWWCTLLRFKLMGSKQMKADLCSFIYFFFFKEGGGGWRGASVLSLGRGLGAAEKLLQMFY